MKTYINKTIIKNLIIIMIITATLSTLVPTSVSAANDTEDGGGILHPIESFVLFLGDKVMEWLQHTFVSAENIEVEPEVWDFKYSPSIIFSGDVPALDINFISPNPGKGNVKNAEIYILANEEKYRQAQSVDSDVYEQRLEQIKSRGYDGVITQREYKSPSTNLTLQYDLYYYVDDKGTEENEDDVLVVETIGKYGHKAGDELVRRSYMYGIQETAIVDGAIDDTMLVYESTAQRLQSTIATWYNALRRIALIGLLSVLIYVGIRMVMSSAAGEKAKYKAMMKDWLVAICLLFTLHYIMSITITVTNELSNIFQTGESDQLLNKLRNEIFIEGDSAIALAKTIMYAVLVIQTVIFTVQYLKRVIFMAFYTLVAPLITLTYPLDKIKDGQAQAFGMWLKEYIYTALIQIIHLVIYTVLVGSALDLVSSYPLYAIIVLAFIQKADGIIKKMFGFSNSDTVGTIGDAVTGGLVMNAINQIANKTKKGGSSGKSESGSGEAANNKVRTVSNDVMSSVRESMQQIGINGNNSGGNIKNNTGNGNPNINGAKAVAGKYFLPATKSIAKATLGTMAGLSGAMLGFAGGVAQGDLGKAFSGAAAGGTAGLGIGKSGVDFASKLGGNVKNSINNFQDTWNEGAYGAEYAQNIRMVREFKQTKEYKELRNEFGDNLTDEKLSEILNAAKKEQNKNK